MSKIFQRSLVFCFFGIMIVSFQGCDQVKKFTDYLSPSRKPASVAVQPEQRLEPSSPAVVQQTVPPAASVTTKEQPKNIAPNVLAKVGAWSISIEEFNEQLKALEDAGMEGFDINNSEQKKYIFGQLLQQQVLVQEALKEKMDQDGKIIEALKAFRDTLLAQAIVEKITANITVSDQELKDFYTQNQKDLVGQTQWHVKEIIVDTEEKARAILVELNQGASFEEIAQAKSIGKTAAQGGDLGMIETFEGKERMGQIVSALDVGAVSGLFQGPQGFYIVKLVDKKEGDIPSLDEIREDLKNYMLMMKQQQAVFDVLGRVQEEAEIYINEKLLEE